MRDPEPRDPLIDGLLERAPAPECPPELVRDIAGALISSLKPVKPLPSTSVLALRIALVFVLLAAGLIGMLGIATFGTLTALQRFGIGTVLSVGVVLFSVTLAWQMRPGSFQRVPAKLSWTMFAVALVGSFAFLLPPRGSEAFVLDGSPCLLIGSAIAVTSGVVFWLIARAGVSVAPVSLGGTIGAIAGLLGATVLQFRCEYQNAGHLALWHGCVLALAIGVGCVVFGAIGSNRNRRTIEVAS
jgi:Negative regulator of sigma F